jgi:hypothetical protein
MLRRLLIALVLVVGVASLARSVLHGPVTGESLALSMDREIGSKGADDDELPPCRLGTGPTWRCEAYSSDMSGTVRYDVVRRADSSCWDAVREAQTAREAELATDMPAHASGCVHRWQWTAVDLVRVFS